jgi:hypothetical protein
MDESSRRRPALLAAVTAVILTLLAAPGWDRPPPAAASARTATSAAHKRRLRPHHRALARRRVVPLKMMWGPATLPDGSSAFPVYHRLGVQVLQMQLSWKATVAQRPADPTDPNDPAYSWPAQIDLAAREAARYHIALALMVKATPPWANGGEDPSWAPDDAADYANFLQAASRHYSAVRYWMIWGEPARAGNFNPMPGNSPTGPRRYAVLLEAAYQALKAVNPANIVIGGMTFTLGVVSPEDFIKWMRLPDGAPPRMDYWGHNPYSFRYPKLSEGPYAQGVRDINDIDTLHSEIAAAYGGRPGGTPKLWLSEFSISSDQKNRAFTFFVSRAAQAKWLTAAFKLVDSVPYVVGLGWFELLDEPPSVPGHLTSGLLTWDARPKPAFTAFARAP